MHILVTAVFLLVPAGVLWLTHHQPWAAKIGIIVLCYTAGLLAGNTGLIPTSVLPVQETISEGCIILALPMLLFTLDVRQWSQVAGKAMLSMVFATASVVIIAASLFFIFRAEDAQAASHLSAMSVAVYTGGTPNLAAIKAGLDIPHSEYIVFHSLDTVFGATYLLAMLTVGIPVFRKLLKPPQPLQVSTPEKAKHFEDDDFTALLQKANWQQLAVIIALSLIILALSLGASRLASAVLLSEKNSALVIVALTTFGILSSLHPRVRRLYLSYKLGMYLIYVFCFTVASMASLDDLRQVNASIAIFLLGTIAGSLLLHALLCRLANVDSDTFMVTSIAAICSPPFVPLMSRALDNPGTLLSGMTTGIIGYALGNYLGISLALFLQGL
jgi:uncharacterized membrane protein